MVAMGDCLSTHSISQIPNGDCQLGTRYLDNTICHRESEKRLVGTTWGVAKSVGGSKIMNDHTKRQQLQQRRQHKQHGKKHTECKATRGWCYSNAKFSKRSIYFLFFKLLCRHHSFTWRVLGHWIISPGGRKPSSCLSIPHHLAHHPPCRKASFHGGCTCRAHWHAWGH